jgi:hypothetical protein
MPRRIRVGASAAQTRRDHIELMSRTDPCRELFPIMERRLSNYSKDELVKQMQGYCGTKGIQRPDRLACRIRAALVCFYCTVAPEFPAGFPPIRPSSRLLANARKAAIRKSLARVDEGDQVVAVDPDDGTETWLTGCEEATDEIGHWECEETAAWTFI